MAKPQAIDVEIQGGIRAAGDVHFPAFEPVARRQPEQ
jgi:hypothetical protein